MFVIELFPPNIFGKLLHAGAAAVGDENAKRWNAKNKE
jgi:hypothetical protein